MSKNVNGINRRSFLKAAGLTTLLPIVARAQDLTGTNNVNLTFGSDQIRVVQGATNATSTLIAILAHKQAQLEITIQNQAQSDLFFETNLIDLKLGEFVIHQIYVNNLSLADDYKLSIFNKASKKASQRTFRTLDWQNTKARVAMLSCSNHRDADPKETMFRQLFASNPDVIFFAGDLVYGNSAMDTAFGRAAKPAESYEIYTKTLMEFEIYNRDQLIPMFTVWDDHDMAKNNADANHPYKDLALKMFRSFFPLDSRIEGILTGPGASFTMDAFGLQYVFLDGRYNKNSKSQKFLGANQLSWLKEMLKTSVLPKVIIGSQQFWNYRSLAESYQKNGGSEFNEFLKLVKDTAEPTLFVSGDVHYSQVQELAIRLVGYRTYEITSSAFFSSSSRGYGKRSPDEGQINYYGSANFIIFDEVKTDSRSIELRVTCISEKSQSQFKRNIVITKS